MERSVEQNDFLSSLLRKVITDSYKIEINNTDYVRYPMSSWKRLQRRLKDQLLYVAGKRNFIYRSEGSSEQYGEKMRLIISQADKLGDLYDSLQDDASRQLLVELLSYRVLGQQRVKLSTNKSTYWRSLDFVNNALLRKERSLLVACSPGYVSFFDVGEAGFPVQLHASTLCVLNTFVLKQYHYHKSNVSIKVEPGDVVIDAGGCWGDTALYFAHMAGRTGHVFSFEFSADNLAIFQTNLELNSTLKGNITVVPQAVWNRSGEKVSCQGEGPSSSLAASENSSSQVKTKAIDDLVREEGLQKVDFIKMDIEGAELNALRGAEQTIKAFRPKLAISIYHRQDDLITIPEFIKRLNMRYAFFLDHFTIHNEETVLFALPQS
jgi:FkbM family methyltransferase